MDVSDLVDTTTGRQKRTIYSNEELYKQELERIFGRCWLFLVHTSQIPKAGDYFRTFMGEDDVIVIRQKDGSIKAFLNSCTHRGNRICRADRGNAMGGRSRQTGRSPGFRWKTRPILANWTAASWAWFR